MDGHPPAVHCNARTIPRLTVVQSASRSRDRVPWASSSCWDVVHAPCPAGQFTPLPVQAHECTPATAARVPKACPGMTNVNTHAATATSPDTTSTTASAARRRSPTSEITRARRRVWWWGLGCRRAGGCDRLATPVQGRAWACRRGPLSVVSGHHGWCWAATGHGAPADAWPCSLEHPRAAAGGSVKPRAGVRHCLQGCPRPPARKRRQASRASFSKSWRGSRFETRVRAVRVVECTPLDGSLRRRATCWAGSPG